MANKLLKIDGSLPKVINENNEIDLLKPLKSRIFLFNCPLSHTYLFKDQDELLSLKEGDTLQLEIGDGKYFEKYVKVLTPTNKEFASLPISKGRTVYNLLEAGKEIVAIIEQIEVSIIVEFLSVGIYLIDY